MTAFVFTMEPMDPGMGDTEFVCRVILGTREEGMKRRIMGEFIPARDTEDGINVMTIYEPSLRVIVHECTHAALWLFRQTVQGFTFSEMLDDVKTSAGEEVVVHTMTEIVDRVLAGFMDFELDFGFHRWLGTDQVGDTAIGDKPYWSKDWP